jgi:glycine oxidase
VAPSRDIVVVGAGVIGCALAYELSRRGASVEVIDDRGTGQGATQASAGMLAPFSEAPDAGPMRDIAGRGLDAYDRFVASLGDTTALSTNYQRSGTLEVAETADSRDRLRQIEQVLTERGIEAHWLEGAALAAAEPALASEVARAGLLISGQGFVGVADLTRALAAAARRHGASFIEHGHVRGVNRAGDELSVVTDRGTLSADTVIIAAGAWSGAIEVEGATTRVPVTPVRGQLLQLHWPHGRPKRVVWSDGCYVVPWADGTVLVGATVEDAGFEERNTVAGVGSLIEAVRALMPGVSEASFVAARAGLRPGSPDHLPIVGRSTVEPRVVYATGHYRNGVLLAPLTAELVADLVIDDRHDPILDVMSPARFGGF